MLRICIGEELLNLSNDDLRKMYINEGNEAKVYRYGDEALKIYRDYCSKPRLDEKTATRLSLIPTKRVLLPKRNIYSGWIYERDFFMGYTLPLVNSKTVKEMFEDMMNMDMDCFLSELDIIRDDMNLLTDKGVIVDDLNIESVLYDGKIYFCDPGRFYFEQASTASSLNLSPNIIALNEFIKDSVLDYTAELIDIYHREFEIDFDISKYIGEQVRDTMKTGETLKQYVRRIMR